MRGLTDEELRTLSEEMDRTMFGEANEHQVSIRDDLVERGLLTRVPCEGDGYTWNEWVLTASGHLAYRAELAVRRGPIGGGQ